jgi:hypothetical protein
MTMGTATTIGAADHCRCAAGLYPCLFRGTRFDQKKTLVVHPVVFLSHPPDHSVSQIDRIKRHIAFFFYASLTLLFAVDSYAALIRRELLSNIEQFQKRIIEIVLGPQRGSRAVIGTRTSFYLEEYDEPDL